VGSASPWRTPSNQLRRSGLGATVDDSAKAAVQSEQAAPSPNDGRTVPEANRTGHHRAVEQDQSDLDAFAERLGVRADESDEADRG